MEPRCSTPYAAPGNVRSPMAFSRPARTGANRSAVPGPEGATSSDAMATEYRERRAADVSVVTKKALFLTQSARPADTFSGSETGRTGGGVPEDNRRRYGRFRCGGEAEIRSLVSPLCAKGRVANLSLSGCLIQLSDNHGFECGELIEMRFCCPPTVTAGPGLHPAGASRAIGRHRVHRPDRARQAPTARAHQRTGRDPAIAGGETGTGSAIVDLLVTLPQLANATPSSTACRHRPSRAATGFPRLFGCRAHLY